MTGRLFTRWASLGAASLAGAGLACLTLVTPGAALTRAGTPPTNVTPPAIGGTPVDGSTLTAGSGSWNGDAPITFTYQWRQCDSGGSACSDLAGETAQTHVVGAGQVGKTLRTRVSATNGAGTAEVVSAPSSVVAAATPPVNTAPPSIGGDAHAGATLTTNDGTWTGGPGPTFAYGWLRCDTSATSCGLIPGQTARTYLLASPDVGFRIRSVVVASNAGGNASAESGPTSVIASAGTAPRAGSQPNVTGTLKVASTLTAATGTWTGTPTLQYSFVWQRCDSSGRCTVIGGATKQTYVPTLSDVGYRLRAIITATNAYGTGSIATNLTASSIAPLGPAPVLTTAPKLSGSAFVGYTLTTTTGTWTSSSSLRYTYSWLRCDSRGSACAAIAAATRNAYTLTSADLGHVMKAQVAASNSNSSTTATSNATSVVGAAPQGLVRLPDGRYSVAASAVELPQRLIVSGVAFTPSRLTSRTRFTARFRVTDTRGYAVRDALVYVIGLPYGIVGRASEVRTDNAGYATLTMSPTSRLSLKRGGSIVMFVRARTESGSVLAGVSTRRLVQVLVGG